MRRGVSGPADAKTQQRPKIKESQSGGKENEEGREPEDDDRCLVCFISPFGTAQAEMMMGGRGVLLLFFLGR